MRGWKVTGCEVPAKVGQAPVQVEDVRRIHRVSHDPENGLEGADVANGLVAAAPRNRLAGGVRKTRHVLVLVEVKVVAAPAEVRLLVERQHPVPLPVSRNLELAAGAQNMDLKIRGRLCGWSW